MTTTTEHKPQRPKRPKRRFDEEFRRDAIALVKSTGKPLGELAAQLGITHWNLRDWMKRERREGQAGAASTQEMQRVITRLQRENESLLETRVTNGVIEALNGVLQLAKRIARGFRSFANFRLIALLKAGGLELQLPTLLPT